ALAEPAGPGIRLDSGIYEGWDVPVTYDPLLAKLVGYGTTREQAIARLWRALGEYFIGGIKNNLPLFQRILSDAGFAAGQTDTGYLDRLLPPAPNSSNHTDQEIAAIAAAVFARLGPAENGSSAPRTNATSNWKRLARTESLR